MKKIKLTQGKTAIVDDCDFELLSRHRWHYSRGGNGRGAGYAITALWDPETKQDSKVRMHRLIMGARKGEVVDHINRNPLDNRRSNLRICSQAQNIANSIGWRRETSSRFKGVTWNRRAKKWQASLGRGGYIGIFSDELEAARAYDAAAIERYGCFARVNFPRGV